MKFLSDEDVRDILSGVAGYANAIRRREGCPVAAVFKYGGYGDFYFLSCIAKAVLRAWAQAGRPLWVLVVATNTGATADLDQTAALTGCNLEVARIPPVDPWEVVGALRRCCEVVYHVPGYVIKRYTQKGFDDAGQREADDLLRQPMGERNHGRPLSDFYFDYPGSNYDLTAKQWELASASSGLDVGPEDITLSWRMPVAEAPYVPISMIHENATRSWGKTRLHGIGNYVVVHNTPGARGTTKALPWDTMQAGIDFLADHGIRCVQVGLANEPRYKHVINRRGTRWALAGRLIAEASAYMGPEGGVRYMAWAARTPAFIAFGPTPASVFQFSNEIALNAQPCRPCWWKPREDGSVSNEWHRKCPRGCEHCENMPTPTTIRRALSIEVEALKDNGRDQGTVGQHDPCAVPVRA